MTTPAKLVLDDKCTITNTIVGRFMYPFLESGIVNLHLFNTFVSFVIVVTKTTCH